MKLGIALAALALSACGTTSASHELTDGSTQPDLGVDSGSSPDLGSSVEVDASVEMRDSATDLGSMDGGSAATPGILECGSMTCDNNENWCCITSASDTAHCCGRSENYGFQMCQNAADCAGMPGSTACCVTQFTSSLDAVCYGSCAAAGGLTSCRTDADCGGSTTCVESHCAGLTFRTCGALPDGACPSSRDMGVPIVDMGPPVVDAGTMASAGATVVTCPGSPDAIVDNFDAPSGFIPSTVSIPAGGIVMFDNVSSMAHSATHDTSLGALTAVAGSFNVEIYPTNQVCLRFPNAGSFPFFCSHHNETGTISVTP